MSDNNEKNHRRRAGRDRLRVRVQRQHRRQRAPDQELRAVPVPQGRQHVRGSDRSGLDPAGKQEADRLLHGGRRRTASGTGRQHRLQGPQRRHRAVRHGSGLLDPAARRHGGPQGCGVGLLRRGRRFGRRHQHQGRRIEEGVDPRAGRARPAGPSVPPVRHQREGERP